MKRIVLCLISIAASFAISTRAQIPNAGFENWTSGEPDGWATSNTPPAGLITVTQSSDSHTGSFAVKGEVVSFFGTPMGPVIQSGPGGTGFPITERYLFMELFYKFTGVGGDKFSVNIGFEKSGNVIAQGAAALPAAVTDYTYLSVPMNYTTNDVPDLAIIQISITGPVAGSDVHVGSVMLVDDLSFSLSSGTGNLHSQGIAVKCHPDPATDFIYVTLNRNANENLMLKIFDITGKEIKRERNVSLSPPIRTIMLSVSDLPAGMYFLTLEGTREHYCEKFSIVR